MSAVSRCPFRIGQAIEFYYPSDNLQGMSAQLERRRVAIHQIRDLEQEPLEWDTRLANHDLCRHRYLIVGHDMVKHEWRRFYIGAIIKPERILRRLIQLAVCDPVIPWAPIVRFGGVYTDSAEDIRLMREVIDKMNHRFVDQGIAVNIIKTNWKPSGRLQH